MFLYCFQISFCEKKKKVFGKTYFNLLAVADVISSHLKKLEYWRCKSNG